MEGDLCEDRMPEFRVLVFIDTPETPLGQRWR